MNRTLSGLLGFVGILLIGVGIVRSVEIVSKTGMVDFRNRVVAARQAELGYNPYFFKWDPSFPETLLDPSDDPHMKYTRLTSPPSTLWFQSLFAGLPYSTQKVGNFVLNWFALFAVAAWIGYSLRATVGPVVLVTGIYSLSALWQFHVERGQQYSFFAFLLTFAMFPPRTALTSLFQALSVFFRPTFGVAIFRSFREKNPIRTILIGAGVGAILLIPVLLKYPLSYWFDYFASTHDWYNHRWGTGEMIPAKDGLTYPHSPEGDWTIPQLWNFGAPGSILHHFATKGGWIPSYTLGLVITGMLTAFSGWRLWSARAEGLAAFALRFFSAVYLTDYFLPSPRSGYNAVLFFPALVLAVIELSRGKIDRTKVAPIAAALGLVSSLEAIYLPYSSPMLVEFWYVVAAVLALSSKVKSVSQDTLVLP
jgi:hypothetical protein